MLTLTELGEMSDEQRTEVFDDLMIKIWPDSTNRADTASEHLGITRQTFFGWRRSHRVPVTVILLLQEWATPFKNTYEVREWAHVATELGEIATTFQTITGQIAKLTDRLDRVAAHRADVLSQIDADVSPEPHESPTPSAE